ncbi:MAG TPA: hypothetical protein VJ302_04990 [Blastocatellia bacterium]|nr:hypothetical protein [Blastocatellia bacterium]
MKYLLLALLISVFALTAGGQSDSNRSKVSPNQWRGMTLDESTPINAVHLFGLPEHDSSEGLEELYLPSKWITKAAKDKSLRRIEFKKLEGVKSAAFFFQSNSLVAIEIEPAKEVNAADLEGIYGLKFEPQVSGIEEGFDLKDFEQGPKKTSPVSFPGSFNMVAVSRQSLIGALIDNGGGLPFMKDGSGKREKNRIPGKVKKIQLISRKLESRGGADSLQ